MNIVFKIADDSGMLLIDLKDFRAMLCYVGDHAAEFTTEYGTISKQMIGAIQHGLLALEEQGGEQFFGEFHWKNGRTGTGQWDFRIIPAQII